MKPRSNLNNFTSRPVAAQFPVLLLTILPTVYHSLTPRARLQGHAAACRLLDAAVGTGARGGQGSGGR